MNAVSTPIARRLRAALFQLRAIVVFVALAIGLIAWMLAGIVAAALASLVRSLHSARSFGPLACRSGAAGRSAVGIGLD